MNTRLSTPLLLLLLACSTGATEASMGLENKKELHTPFDGLLSRHVKKGIVDYAGLGKEVKVLDAYLADLAKEDEKELESTDRLAFWINAYNACTLRLILDQDPRPKSIRDLDSPWDTRRWKVAGRTLSLNDIEHEIIREEFEEPRIHFALVCAARSCPDLRSKAYRGDRIEKQLADATSRFLGDRKKGLAFESDSDGSPVLRLSKLFDWYDDDFEIGDGTVVDFLIDHLGEKGRAWLERNREDLDIEYFDYDWSLNDR